MPKIFRNVLIVIGFLLVLAVVMLIAGQGELLKSIVLGLWGGIKAIWLWIIGFFGFFIAGFKKLGSLFGPTQAEKEIRAENEDIKLEFEKIREQVTLIDDQLKRERDLHQREVVIYEEKLMQKEQEIELIKGNIQLMEEMTPEEYFETLSDEEKDQFYEHANQEVFEIGE